MERKFYLKEYREISGLSQRQLGIISGISYAAISKIERHNRDPLLSTAIALSKALCLSVYDMCEKPS